MLKDHDIILERCYARNMGGGSYKSNLADDLEIIRAAALNNLLFPSGISILNS